MNEYSYDNQRMDDGVVARPPVLVSTPNPGINIGIQGQVLTRKERENVRNMDKDLCEFWGLDNFQTRRDPTPVDWESILRDPEEEAEAFAELQEWLKEIGILDSTELV